MPQITSQDHQKGAENGEITIVKFSEFECPYCARFKPTMQRILDEYPDKVTYVFKHFPLNFHQYAKQAAVASECAAEQGKFWEMYDKLFELNETQTLNTANIKKAAVEIGLE
jgi:protein-disulfide isomerase